MTDEEVLAFCRKILDIPLVHTLLLLDRGDGTYAFREVSPDSDPIEHYGTFAIGGFGAFSIQDNVAPFLNDAQRAVFEEVKALVDKTLELNPTPEKWRPIKVLTFNDYPHIFKKDWSAPNLWGGVLPEMHSALWVLDLRMKVRRIDLSFTEGKNGHDLTIQQMASSRI